MSSLSPKTLHTLAAAWESFQITASGLGAAFLLFLFVSGHGDTFADALAFVRANLWPWIVANAIIPSIRAFLANRKFPIVDTASTQGTTPAS